MGRKSTFLCTVLVSIVYSGSTNHATSDSSSPPSDLLRLFTEKGYTDASSVAVVGNGPLSVSDRALIAFSSIVIRFNDVNNKLKGEKTTVRVVRHPSWFTFKHVVHPEWHVSPKAADIPSDARVVTYVYESQHGLSNAVNASERLFPSCNCGPSCLHSTGWAGPSTGGAALSLLQEVSDIRHIHVFGMNWNGDADMHTDFANKSIVTGCCTKCIFHPTANTNYGAQLVGGMLVAVVVAVFVFCACTSLLVTRSVIGYSRTHHLPLIALNPAHHNLKKEEGQRPKGDDVSSLDEPLLDKRRENSAK